VKENRPISIVYGILLAVGLILCVGAFIFIPVDVTNANERSMNIELVPTEVVNVDEDVREFHFVDVNWENKGSCLHFVSSHQEVKVVADGLVLFRRKAAYTLWGHTTGFSWEYVEIPTNTHEVTVSVRACYPQVRNSVMTFYQGFSINMFQQIVEDQGFTFVVSMLDAILGLLLFIYGAVSYKRSSIGGAMVYLGIFTTLLGIWSLTENGIVAVLVHRRAASSFTSFMMLALIGIPFIMFVRCYLQSSDKYVYKALLLLNFVNGIIVFSLQLLGIRDVKQTLTLTHIAMIGAVLYLPYSLVCMARKGEITRRFWVTLSSILCMCPPLVCSLYMYYSGSHNVISYGNVFIFLFVVIFAIDVSRSIIKDVREGKKAALYKELAEKDMLTGCYNRNCYRNDTENLEILDDLLIVTCDLNNLKQCNDTLGHAYGDQYITDSAKLLMNTFSDFGKVYRIGGDEFCIVIPNAIKCNIGELMARLKKSEGEYNAKSEVVKIQIAIGHAVYDPQKDSNVEDVRNRADELMYQNKAEIKKMNTVLGKIVPLTAKQGVAR
jgi:diguanylate cyclase (GGDEF)-like protein